MKTFFWNLLFGLVWAALTGVFTLPNLALGMAFGAVSLFFIRHQKIETPKIWLRVGPIFSLAVLFLYELAVSALKVAGIALRPNVNLQPGIFSYETKLTKDSHISLLANLITLTPGTLTINVSEDRRTLYIHALDCADVEANRLSIRNGFEQKIAEAFGVEL